MNFASTPARSAFNAENDQSIIQRKLGSNRLQVRTPLQDRAVNYSNTPNSHFKKPKSDIPSKHIAKSLFRHKLEDLETLEHEISCKDYDEQFEELYSTPLNEKHVFNIVRNYVNSVTPPPSPQMLPELIDLSLDELSYEYVHESRNDDYETYFKTPPFGRSSMNDDGKVDIPFPTPPEFQELVF